MSGLFKTPIPLTAEQRRWIDERFAWLREQFGEDRLRGTVVTPTDEFFPDPYAGTTEDAAALLDRLCTYMDVDRSRIDLKFYTTIAAEERAAAHDPTLTHGYALGAFEEQGGRIAIWLEVHRLKEPLSVISTLAHELGHVHLLADGRCDPETADHEPLTDLLTVFFGFGIFGVNSALREINWSDGLMHGYSMARQGYLSVAEFAYALALYAHARGEYAPSWLKHLRPDARKFFKSELRELVQRVTNAEESFRALAVAKPAVEVPRSASEVDEGNDRHHPNAPARIDIQEATEENSDAEELAGRTNADADEYFTQGIEAAVAHHHQQAIEAFSRALELKPNDAEIWLCRAQSHRGLGNVPETLEDCCQSLRLDPDNVDALCLRAGAYIWLRRYTEAIADLDRAWRIDPVEPQVHYLRGVAHLGLGKFKQAIIDLNEASRFAPIWGEVYLARSRAYRALGNTLNAEADWAEALGRNPGLAETKERETCLCSRILIEPAAKDQSLAVPWRWFARCTRRDAVLSARLIAIGLALVPLYYMAGRDLKFLGSPQLMVLWIAMGGLFGAGLCAPAQRKTRGATIGIAIQLWIALNWLK